MNKTWIIASSNDGKFKEIKNFFGKKLSLISMSDKNIPVCNEPFSTFIENALHKARHVSRITKMPTIADDSGLVVDVLKGKPGVKSSRFFQGKTNLSRDEANNNELLQRMQVFQDPTQRSAYFVAVIVGLDNFDDPFPAIGIGTWHGKVLTKSIGTNGHGYDPVFFCPRANKTAGQMSVNEKEKYSHRRLALESLLKQLKLKNF